MHGKTLLGLITVIALSLVLSISLAGCAKKKAAESKGTQTPQLSKETTDTSDVFMDFYSEDSAAKKAAANKGAKQETFSTASAPVSAAEFSENGRYTVQVSCVRSQSFANSMVSKLKDKGYPAYVAEVQNPTPSLSGTFYRVRIGGYNAVSGAKSFGENTLIANGYEYWVDKKSNDNVGMEGYSLGSGSAGSSAAGSYNTGGSTSSSTESSFSTTPSSGSSSFGSTSTSGTTGSSSFESSSTPSSSPASGTTGGSSTTSDFGSSGTSTSTTSTTTTTSTTSQTPSSTSGSSFGTTPSSTGSSTGTSGTGSTGGAKDTSSGGW